ncbi:MAG: DNA cytosine methyltransferase [Candidatus Thiodiazotropha endolucinida]
MDSTATLDSIGITGTSINSPSSKTKKKIYTLNCVDLFAGAGGLSLAAKNVSLNVVAAVELDKHACSTYSRNIVGKKSTTNLYSDDILALNPKRLKKENFPPGTICDIVLGGPPCQGFSSHRINDAGVNDPRNAMLLRYFEYVRHLSPKVFLMENVPGLLWARHEDFLEKFYKQGSKTGYKVLDPTILDARNFGVPQRRKRVFILGIKKGIDFNLEQWPPQPTHGNDAACKSNPELLNWVSANNYGVFKKAAKGDPNNHHMNHTPEMVNTFKKTPPNGGSRHQSGRVLPCHEDHNGHRDVYGRINPKEPGPTMTTACINPSKGRFVHPMQHHGITLRQAARFQTFPDDFIFEGGLMAGGAQIGNAVPVKLGEALLRAVLRGLDIEAND